jgi:MarR family
VSQRFSIIPARAILDKTLTDLDIRVLGVFGIHADTETGWCFKNQSKIAEELGVARQSVSRSCNRLYAGGYVEARDINAGKSKTGRRSINCYRILMDSKAEPPQAVIDALSPCGDNEPALSPSGDSRCHPSETTVVTPGRQLNVPLRTNPLERNPQTPSGGDLAKIDQAGEKGAPPIPAAPIATQAAHSAPHSPAFETAWRAVPRNGQGGCGPPGGRLEGMASGRMRGCRRVCACRDPEICRSGGAAQCSERPAYAQVAESAPLGGRGDRGGADGAKAGCACSSARCGGRGGDLGIRTCSRRFAYPGSGDVAKSWPLRCASRIWLVQREAEGLNPQPKGNRK